MHRRLRPGQANRLREEHLRRRAAATPSPAAAKANLSFAVLRTADPLLAAQLPALLQVHLNVFKYYSVSCFSALGYSFNFIFIIKSNIINGAHQLILYPLPIATFFHPITLPLRLHRLYLDIRIYIDY
jgi:hypothetical protein